MASFSWSDGIRAALSPCLTCLRPHNNSGDSDSDDTQHHNRNRGPDFIPRAQPDELEGLLADADDAETLSLHSNIGIGHKRRKKRARTYKTIKLFGFDLFGRPPIQLPEDEDEDDEVALGRGARARTISGSTVDSDAAPLDPSTIARLSTVRMAESAQQEEDERKAKEDRRKQRRERKKAQHQAALAAAFERGEGDEFEGFPGSGNGLGSSHGPGTHSSDGRSSATHESFGAFEQARPSPQYPEENVDEDDADFDGQVYSKPSRAIGGSGSGSDSRSRTSGSMSNADPARYNHHFLSQQEHQQYAHYNNSQAGPPDVGVPPPPRKKKTRFKSSRHSATTSRSDSISTPPPHYTTFPAIVEQSQDDTHSYPHPAASAVSSAARAEIPVGGFPSVGFGGGRLSRKNSEAGVFLARRGDE